MRLAVEHGLGEFDANLAARADLFGQAGKKFARRVVGRRDRGFEKTDLTKVLAPQQVQQHLAGNTLATKFVGHGHLPDEQRVVALRLHVGRDETGDLAAFLRHHAGAREVLAQEQVGIGGIVVQRAARAHQRFNVGTVFGARLAQLERKVGWFNCMNMFWGQVSVHWSGLSIRFGKSAARPAYAGMFTGWQKCRRRQEAIIDL